MTGYDILVKALDRLESYPHLWGRNVAYTWENDIRTPVCAFGHLAWANNWENYSPPIVEAEKLLQGVVGTIPSWNDDEDTQYEDVVIAFRTAIARARVYAQESDLATSGD